MRFVGLVSGGKDSIYCIMKCLEFGHELVGIANLTPPDLKLDEIDSFMYQTIGHNAIEALAQCLGVPLFRQPISGKPLQTALQYTPIAADTAAAPATAAASASASASANALTVAVDTKSTTAGSNSSSGSSAVSGAFAPDEVEDLLVLLQNVQRAIPSVQAVSSGAILSNYQRTRIENVCGRLGLVSLAYLWQRDQRELLHEMIHAGQMNAIIVKVASMGLIPRLHLGRSLAEMESHLNGLGDKYQTNICGEGGEYETFTLDCPIFKQRIVVDSSELVGDLASSLAPVAVYRINKLRIEPKQTNDQKAAAPATAAAAAPATATATAAASTTTAAPPTALAVSNASADSKLSAEKLTPPRVTIRAGGADHAFSFVSAQYAPEAASTSASFSSRAQLLFDTFAGALQQSAIDMAGVFYVHLYLSDMKNFAAVNELYKRTFPGVQAASRCCIELSALGSAGIALDAVFTAGARRTVLHVQSISSWAPCCIGPYSQGTSVCGLVTLAGQIGLVPATMIVPSDASPLQQLAQCVANNKAVLRELDSSLAQTLLCIVYVASSVAATEHASIRQYCAQHIHHSDTKELAVVLIVVSALPRGAAVELQVVNYNSQFTKHVWTPPKPQFGGRRPAPSAAATRARVVRAAKPMPVSFVQRIVNASAAADTKSGDATTAAVAPAFELSECGVASESQFLSAFTGLRLAVTSSGAPSAAAPAVRALVAAALQRCETAARLPYERTLSARVYYDPTRIDAAALQSEFHSALAAARATAQPATAADAKSAATAALAPSAITFLPVTRLPALIADATAATASASDLAVLLHILAFDASATHRTLVAKRIPCACYSPAQIAALAAVPDGTDDDADASE